jgi:hypothetical protein
MEYSMNTVKFSNWTCWNERNSLPNISYPGIYAIAISSDNISKLPYKIIKSIAYFGMTNSKGGLRSRLRQFDHTIAGRTGHGGAKRFRFKYNDYNKLSKNLYVSVCPFICDVKSNEANDLLIMGKVAEFEYKCFAGYVKKFKRLPEFNDKKLSPKK